MIQTIIIDDEKKCIALLQQQLQKSFPEVQVVATSSKPEEGIKLIRQHEPNLLFLDIEMPLKNGFQVLEATRDVAYDVIFTTAYQQYAINAIRFAALDYLLKPIEAEELAGAIGRYKSRHKKDQQQQQFDLLFNNLKNITQPFHKISIATTEGIIFINTTDIVYIEASGSYSKVFLRNGDPVLTSKNLKEFEEMLSQQSFFRVHHSYIVNTNEIKRYLKGDGGFVIMSNAAELPVSKRRKEEFILRLKV
jgi:two-component system LytT family response regulator